MVQRMVRQQERPGSQANSRLIRALESFFERFHWHSSVPKLPSAFCYVSQNERARMAEAVGGVDRDTQAGEHRRSTYACTHISRCPMFRHMHAHTGK